MVSIAEKMRCVPQTLHEWVKKAEVNSGKRAGVPTEVADEAKVWNARFVNCGSSTRFCARRQRILLRRSSTARLGDNRVY